MTARRWGACREVRRCHSSEIHGIHEIHGLRSARIPCVPCISDSAGGEFVTFRIGVVDTTFSRVNMGQVALDELRKRAKDADIRRTTVPGVKDLPAAARRFFDEGCDLVIACGMVGAEEVEKVCGHEASLGLMWLRAQLGKPLLEVFIHMDEPFERDALGKVAKRPTTPAEISKYETELKALSAE